jgi:hypothetical protein
MNILNLDTSTINTTALAVASKASFVAVDTKINGASRETVYQKISGSEEYPMVVRVGFYPNPAANGGIGKTSISLKVNTFVEKVVSAATVWTLPGDVVLAINMPGTTLPDSDDVIVLVQNALSWLLPLVDGDFSVAAIDELRDGVTLGLLGHVDTGAA